jgi:hypothetical protein
LNDVDRFCVGIAIRHAIFGHCQPDFPHAVSECSFTFLNEWRVSSRGLRTSTARFGRRPSPLGTTAADQRAAVRWKRTPHLACDASLAPDPEQTPFRLRCGPSDAVCKKRPTRPPMGKRSMSTTRPPVSPHIVHQSPRRA